MSLRKLPQPTSQLLDAARSNGRRSHGPCTAAGKQNSKMNGVKHGERSAPENHYEVMRALGEDPARFEALKRELRGSFGPGDAFFDKQVDDLARLYWRRDRLERSQTGLMRRALLEVEERQHRRRKEIEGAAIAVGEAIDVRLVAPSDPAARLRLLLSLLGAVGAEVQARRFLPWQAAALKGCYGGKGGWRAGRIGHLLSVFADPDIAARLMEAPGEPAGLPCEPTEVRWHKELLRLLEAETASVAEEFEYEQKLNEEKTAIERDACLAPAGEEWRMLLRREESLDRAIDRKIKLLLTLRKGSTGTLACAGVGAAEGLETGKSACPTPEEMDASGTGTPACAEASMAGSQDLGVPGPIEEEPSPEGSGCQAPAVSSAGA
jgi:hypothetical protein